MELRHYFRLIRKGWPVILAAMVLCTALGLGVTLASKKIYQANVQLFVALTPEASSQLAQGNTFVQDRVQSYLEFATAPAVTAPVISSLKLPLKQDKLAGEISADAPQNEVLINLHVQDTDPTRAATVANALAAQYAKIRRGDRTDRLDRQADWSSSPSSTRRRFRARRSSRIRPSTSGWASCSACWPAS